MRDQLRQLAGLGHLLRPAGIKSPEDFNRHLVMAATAIQTLVIPVEKEPEPETAERVVPPDPKSDRMERGGRKRGRPVKQADPIPGASTDEDEAKA